MEIHNSSTKTYVTLLVATICFSILATIANNNQITIAQGQPSTQPNSNAPLSFFLKLGNNQSTSTASSQAASNGTGTKNITVTVNVQKGPSGNPIKLPISAVVPKNVNQQDLQLCAALAGGQQMCQPLTQNAPNIDLSSNSSGAAKTTPQTYHDGSRLNNILGTLSNQIIPYADAQLLSLDNTNINIPITVIVPITLEIQNAQICASVASSGGTSCQQLVLNPTQSAFTPVNVDLSNPTTPTVSTLSASVPSTQQLTGGATGSNNTSTGTNNTGTASTGTNNTAGTTNSGGTNTTSTQGSPSSTTTSNQPSSTTQQPTSTQPSQDNTKNKDNGNPDKKNP